MQEKKIWTLVALAMLTALTLVRPERALDGRVGGRGTSRSVPTSSEKGAIVSDRLAVSAFPPHAGSAWLLFRADWGVVLWRVYQKMNDNRLLAVAAGVVFYGLLAVFPAITAFVSLYGLMADPSTIHERLSLATGILPQGALNILNEQLTRLTSHRTSALSVGFIGGLLVALWSANAGAPRPSWMRSTLLTAKLRNGALSTSILSRSLSRSARSLRLCSLWELQRSKSSRGRRRVQDESIGELTSRAALP